MRAHLLQHKGSDTTRAIVDPHHSMGPTQRALLLFGTPVRPKHPLVPSIAAGSNPCSNARALPTSPRGSLRLANATSLALFTTHLWTEPSAHIPNSLPSPLLLPQVTAADLEAAVAAVGDFGADNRAGVPGTLHRISAMRNRRGAIVGLTCRVGRAVAGHISMLKDLVESE